jgi:tetratricopeptide (TPR) repeat protein
MKCSLWWMKPRWLTAAACVIVAVVVAWIHRPPPQSIGPSIPADLAATASVDPGFVGWQVCQECHARRVEEFQQTRHFHALRFAAQVDFPRGFRPTENVFEPPRSPVRFEFRLQPAGAALLAAAVRDPSARPTTSPIEFVYGAGAGTDEVYFTRRGDGLYELPTVWLNHQGCWSSSQFDPHGTGDLSRPVTPQCLECHNTWVDYHRGSLNQYGPLEAHLVGVTCERCHGPADTHVRHHRASPDDKLAAAIVRPKMLSRERQMDLCAQCHTNSVRYRRPPFSFRAGESLDDSFRVLEMRHPELDRVANQTRYLKESRCYQQSETLTCTTCHDPHRKPSAADGGSVAQACLKCHQPHDCAARGRSPEGVRDDCIGCHMPQRKKIQVNFETANEVIEFPAARFEHRIAIYPAAEMEVLYVWYATQSDDVSRVEQSRLGRTLMDHWHSVATAARNESRFLVAIDACRTALRFGESVEIQRELTEVSDRHRRAQAILQEGMHLKQRGQLDEAIARFELLLGIQANSAQGHYELATLYAATDKIPEARQHLRAASENDPNDPGPEALLGWIDHLAGRHAAALEHYQRARQVDPWSEKIEFMIGRCLMQLGQWDGAVAAFERALEVDPGHRESTHAARQILRERFSPSDALGPARKIVELTAARQTEPLLTLAEVCRDLGQIPEAEQTLRAARKIAQQHEPELLPQVQAAERSLRRAPAAK